MRIHVVGAGGLGGTMAAGMARGGVDVAVIDRERTHVEEVRHSGLRMTGHGGEFTIRLPAFHPEEVDGPLKAVFLSVKSQHTLDALEFIAPRLAPDGFILSLQNGLNAPCIAERVGQNRTLGAMISLSADYHGPGHIHRGSKGRLFIGELDGRITGRVRQVVEALAHTPDTVVTASDNIYGNIWAKHSHACLDITTAVADMDREHVLANPDYFPVLARVVGEAARLGRAQGVRIETYNSFDPNAFLLEGEEGKRRMKEVLGGEVEKEKASLKKRTGYWRDIVVRKRKTEVDYISGHIEDGSRDLGLPAPVNGAVRRMIHEAEEGKRQLGPHNMDELLAIAGGFR